MIMVHAGMIIFQGGPGGGGGGGVGLQYKRMGMLVA